MDSSHSMKQHANRHVAKFLQLPEQEETYNSIIQVLDQGQQLTSRNLLDDTHPLSLNRPILVQDTPESIGMKVLSYKKRQVTVRDIADTIGHHYPVHVIDVEHQEELEGWTLTDLVDYFEDEERLMMLHQQEAAKIHEVSGRSSRRRRKAAEKCLEGTGRQRPRVLNQISLEFSKTGLRKSIQSPQFVRDMDWIDQAWPGRAGDHKGDEDFNQVYPNVQYYVLTSAAGCYTDFHVDFGGTAVWYHILNGEKVFCLITPTEENLSVYEDWLCRPDQAELFLPDMIPNQDEVLRVSLKASQTLIIPTAWIHAVYTPTDSVVLGGNFLHGLDIPLQVAVHCIESRTRVQEKFRFPFFLPVHFYAGGMYLKKLRKGQVSKREVEGLPVLLDALDEWWKVQTGTAQLQTGPTVTSAAEGCAKATGCVTVEAFLSELRKEYERVKTNGVSPAKQISATSPVVSVVSTPPPVPSQPKPTKVPKLRLKLKSSSRPPATTSSASPPKKDGSKFRIVVSSEAVRLSAPVPVQLAAPPKSKRPREDTEWIDEGPAPDDEWTPTKSKKRSSLNIIAKGTNPDSGGQPSPRERKAPPPTSRQRLMKRFR